MKSDLRAHESKANSLDVSQIACDHNTTYNTREDDNNLRIVESCNACSESLVLINNLLETELQLTDMDWVILSAVIIPKTASQLSRLLEIKEGTIHNILDNLKTRNLVTVLLPHFCREESLYGRRW